MTRVLLSQQAERDIEEIGRYTQREWGRAQRRTYLAEIEARCAFIARAPQVGAIRDNVRPGLRSVRAGRHLIFYRLSGADILISRVLHEARDIAHQAFDEV